ncbi:MAG: DUF1015 family protein [Pseudomonadota bacterium]
MATIRPFRAHRPPATCIARVASPPYDVVSTKEARQLAAGNPASYLHVSRPEIDLPEGTDEHDDRVYAQGAVNLESFVERGVLVQESAPRFYAYSQKMGQHVQTGLVACASVDDYVADRIKKHEKTRADKEDDRTKHIDVLGAHDEPVFLTYRAVPEIDVLMNRVVTAPPLYDFITVDEVRHTMWAIDSILQPQLIERFAAVDTLYVADGHHRSAAAVRVHERRRGQPGEHDVFLVVVFPHDQMQIMAYNRVVRDSKGRSPEELLAAFRERFDVTKAAQPAPREPKSFGLFLGGTWYLLRAKPSMLTPADASDPVASLDASICQSQILAPMFGITDPRRDKNVDFVGGIRGSTELEKLVGEGWTLALHLFPTSMEQLMAVSDAGLLMPPKSTWFEPKLRSGLFVHLF